MDRRAFARGHRQGDARGLCARQPRGLCACDRRQQGDVLARRPLCSWRGGNRPPGAARVRSRGRRRHRRSLQDPYRRLRREGACNEIKAFPGEVGTGSPQKTRQRKKAIVVSDSEGTETTIGLDRSPVMNVQLAFDTAAPLPEPFAGWFARRGWAPREHQLELLAKARAGRSVLLIAPTGAGKTLAGFLPSLVELSERAEGLSTAVPRARPAPSPLAGEGWGGGWQQTQDSRSPPSLSLPRRGGGNAVAH